MLLLVDTGYAIDGIEFWGIRVFDPEKPFNDLVNLEIALKSFEIVDADEDKVTYRKNIHTSDDSIVCYALMNEDGITIAIFNNSKMPIEFNFYGDKYYSISKDGSFYKLTPIKKDYPETLNPKKYAVVKLTLDGISYTDIEYLMMLINIGRYCVFLKQIKK